MKQKNLQVALLAAAHIVACAWLLWYLMPRPEGHEIVVEGVPVWKLYSSSRTNDAAVQVNGLTLACNANAVGQHSYSCPKLFEDGLVSRVTYFEMTTLEAALGLVDPPLILLAIEQAGRVTYRKSGDKLRQHYFIGGSLIPIFIFAISFIWLKNKCNAKRTNSMPTP